MKRERWLAPDMKLLITAPLFILLVGLAAGLFVPAISKGLHFFASTPSWKELTCVGTVMTETDPQPDGETFRFGDDDYVAVTWRLADGSSVLPLLCWKIENGKLLIYDKQQTYRELSLISWSDPIVTVEDQSGRRLDYRVTRQHP